VRHPLQLREHRNIIGAERSSDVVAPRKKSTTQLVDSVTLLSPPRGLVLGLTNLPLRCRELVLAEDPDYGGVTFSLLLDSTGPTLESLVIRNMFNPGGRSFSHFVRVPVPDHDENPARSDDYIRKLSEPSQVEDGGTIRRNANVHQ